MIDSLKHIVDDLPEHVLKFCEQKNLNKVMIGIIYRRFPIEIEIMCNQNSTKEKNK